MACLLQQVAQHEERGRLVRCRIASGAVASQLRKFRKPVAGSGDGDHVSLMARATAQFWSAAACRRFATGQLAGRAASCRLHPARWHASKLAGDKAAASCRTPEDQLAGRDLAESLETASKLADRIVETASGRKQARGLDCRDPIGPRASSRGGKRQQAAALQSCPKYPWDRPRTRPPHARDLPSFA
jgi:hypothetical protein